MGVSAETGDDLDRNGQVAAMRTPPEQCASMAEVRAGVDSLDGELVRLLAERFRFMNAAARIKPERGMVRDEARKQQVIRNAMAQAETLGLDPALIGELWDRLVEASIAHELREWDQADRGDGARTAAR